MAGEPPASCGYSWTCVRFSRNKNGEFDGILQPRGQRCKAHLPEGQPEGGCALSITPSCEANIPELSWRLRSDSALKLRRRGARQPRRSLACVHKECARSAYGMIRVASQSPTLVISQVISGNQDQWVLGNCPRIQDRAWRNALEVVVLVGSVFCAFMRTAAQASRPQLGFLCGSYRMVS